MLPSRRLKEALAERGLSQKQVAAKLKIRSTYLCALLAGDRHPSVALSVALCELVGFIVHPVDLCLGREGVLKNKAA